jgi:ABC-2 type transport system ATP-binding protein
MAAHTDAAVAAEELVCAFRATTALAGVDLEIAPGQIHALLGPNGAGKTTLLRVVAGLQRPTAGWVDVLGRTPRVGDRATASRVALVPTGNRSFYLRLSGEENLRFFAKLYGVPAGEARTRARRLLTDVGLDHAGKRRVGLYSHGMQKRLAVARALLVDPDVLVIDEATHDLDPAGAECVLALVRAAAARGAAVLWATQRLDEIRGFADRVTVLDAGRVRFVGTVSELVAVATTQRYLVRMRAPGALVATAGAALDARGTVVEAGDGEHHLLALRDDVVLGDALAALTAAGIDVLACRDERSRVEAALLSLTAPVEPPSGAGRAGPRAEVPA